MPRRLLSNIPLSVADDLVYTYFDANNNLETIYLDDMIDGIAMYCIPEVLVRIIENAFVINPDIYNITNFIDENNIDCDLDSWSDDQINLMLTRIRNVLNIHQSINDRKSILHLYSCAVVRDPSYDWHSYIMYNSEYEILDLPTPQGLYVPVLEEVVYIPQQ